MNFKVILPIFFASALVLTVNALPLTTGPFSLFNDSPIRHFKLTETPPYKDTYKESLKYLLVTFSKNNLSNEFCMIGYQWKNKTRSAVIFWKSGETLFNWNLDDIDNDYYYKSLLIDNSISLSSSVYPLKEILKNPGKYMQAYSQESINEVWNDCKSNGEFIIIDKFPLPKNCDNSQSIEYEYDINKEHLCDAVNLRDK